MRISNKLFKMRLTINKIFIILLILSFLGFVDATYLTLTHYKHIVPPCTILNGCERVLSSKFAVVFGIPLAMYGSFYFFASIVLDVLMLQHLKNSWIKKIFILFNFSGVIAAVILLLLQFIVLKAACQYCLLVELILFLSFVFSILLLKRGKLG